MIVFHIAVLYIIFRYMNCFFDAVRVKKSRDLEAYALYLAAVCLVDMLPAAMPVKFVTDTLFLYLLAQLYHGKQGKKLLAASLIQGMNLFCEALAVYVLYDCKVDGEYGRELYYINFLFMYVCEHVMEKFCIRNIREDASLKHWDLLIFLPVISVSILFVLITFDVENRYIGSAVSAGIICLNLTVFYICDELVGAYIKLKESALVARQLESYSNQLNVVMKSEEKVRGLRHDLKHHLSEILMLADRNRPREIADYVRNMQADLLSEGEHISSGNADIDSLVNLMLERAKKELGSVRCRVCVPQELDISAFDWNIILGNLMDNAIDAAKRSEDKLLQLKVHYRKGMLFIDIKNSYNGELLKAEDRYLSTKDYDRTDESQVHGLGIRNVRRIVEKYNGSMEISDVDAIFEVRILMYVSIKNDSKKDL
ncbi:MAG: GHKL domain-containing protein [Lachnospiraceae bacterium]|nr:GHKL domain-containing protein [Lachnospiraceae bacterium]